MTIQVTEEQLNDIVKKAIEKSVKSAVIEVLQKKGVAVDVSLPSENTKEATHKHPEEISIGTFTDEEYQEALSVMAANRGKGDAPKVGIFWYNVSKQCLFGVISHKRIDYDKPNAGGGLITCSEMHEDVWKKEYYKQKYHSMGNGPFKGEYQYKPRGRVFYSPADDQYIIAVGTWIEQHKEALPLIYEEFDLPKDKTIIKQAHHWDIGQTWM